MKPPKKMGVTPSVDLSQEKPVVGNMNYARKFTEEPTAAYAAPGMPVNVQKRKVTASKNSGYLAMYKEGTRSITTSGDRESADPSVPFGEEPETSPNYLSDEDANATPASEVVAPAATISPRKMGGGGKKAAPSSYQDAAKLIRADKGLYAQYKAGVASGKAFTLNVGGKPFKYAATEVAASPTPKAVPTRKMAASAATPLADDAYMGESVRGGVVGKAADSIAAMPPAKKMTTKAATDSTPAPAVDTKNPEPNSTEAFYNSYDSPELTSPSGQKYKASTEKSGPYAGEQYYANGRKKMTDGKMANANDLLTSAKIRKMKK